LPGQLISLLEGMLLGAIVLPSAAAFPSCGLQNLGLKGNIRQTLELESGSNDPMAYFLTIMLIMLIMEPDKSFIDIIPLFLMQFIFGGMVGLLMGKAGHYIINSIKLDLKVLSVLAIALMLFTFTAADFIKGNGFLAVYIAALYLATRIHLKNLS
jgi:cell volume regulation protein A